MSNYITRLPDDAVQINRSLDYIDPRGNVYGVERRHNNPNKGKFFIKTQSTVWGYKYCGICYTSGKRTSKRVHRLVAEAFLPNPHKLPVVMHQDNNKKNNCVTNLKWGSIQENTAQAYADGLGDNASGWRDSQSMPVDQYDTVSNQCIATYGSVREAERATGISESTILHQCKNTSGKIRKTTYFVFHGEPPRPHDIVLAYDSTSGEELGRYANTRLAGEAFGLSPQTVSDYIVHGKRCGSKATVCFNRVDI